LTARGELAFDPFAPAPRGARVVLVRAGPPSFGGRVAGALEVPLATEGHTRAVAAAAAIRAAGGAARVYAPPAGFAHEAGRAIADELAAELKPRDDLAEVDLGLWQGLLEVELEQRHPDALRAWRRDARAVVPPGGEETREAFERLDAELVWIAKKQRKDPRPSVIVAGPLAHALLVAAAHATGPPPDLWQRSTRGTDVVEALVGT
jgi:probable phosphoglycerate mutase